ncbi:MAG: hypothetical protein ACRC28_18455 [Clostridium sp.]|uniref:hypothetical protein n=1 Tax=Clostridium sp. TaxID=1506 RepID=UPI003F3FF7D5
MNILQLKRDLGLNEVQRGLVNVCDFLEKVDNYEIMDLDLPYTKNEILEMRLEEGSDLGIDVENEIELIRIEMQESGCDIEEIEQTINNIGTISELEEQLSLWNLTTRDLDMSIDDILDYDTKENEDKEEYINYLEETGLISEVEGHNTYNWASNLSNEIQFTVYEKETYGVVVAFRVHLFGDVRANYSDIMLIELDTKESFFELLGETTTSFEIEVEGETYRVSTDGLCEGGMYYIDGIEREVYISDIEGDTEIIDIIKEYTN